MSLPLTCHQTPAASCFALHLLKQLWRSLLSTLPFHSPRHLLHSDLNPRAPEGQQPPLTIFQAAALVWLRSSQMSVPLSYSRMHLTITNHHDTVSSSNSWDIVTPPLPGIISSIPWGNVGQQVSTSTAAFIAYIWELFSCSTAMTSQSKVKRKCW